MRRVNEIIDAVKGVLSGATIDSASELALAQEVVRACTDTRERLVRSVDLMRRGLRGEALVIIEVRPTLTEIAAALSVPIMLRWSARCAERGLPVPPLIDVDLVHEISEGVAEAEDPRVDQLMRRMRYQNLAHAPAYERLRTMWALRRIDIGAVYDEDVRAFEQAALKELMDRLRKSVESNDMADAAAVREELRRSDWSARGIEAARATAEERCNALGASHAIHRCGSELDHLEACIMRGDSVAARTALDRYEAVVVELRSLRGETPEELKARAAPLALWVADRERSETQARTGREAMSRLEALALSAQATPLELEVALLECDRAGLSVAEAIRESVERRILSERRRRFRVRAAIISCAVLGVVAGIASVGWWAVQRQRQSELVTLVATVDSARERGELDAAERSLTEAVAAAPWMKDAPEISEARGRIGADRAEMARLDADFERALEAAGDPAPDSAKAELGEAAVRLARTPEQSLRAERWMTTYRAERARRQQAADSTLMDEVARLSARLGEIEAAAGARDADLDGIKIEAERLSRNTSAGPDAQHSVRELTSRIGSLQDMIARERALRASQEAEARAIAMLVERAPESYGAALQEFIRDYPESARIPEFRAAALSEPAWRDVLGLGELSSRLGRAIDSGDSLERARAAEAVDKAIETSPSSPWMPALRSVRELCIPQDRWSRLVEDLVTLNPVMRLRMVELKDGTRYYYDGAATVPREVAGGRRLYTVMVSADGRTQTISVVVSAIASDGPSPQAALCDALRPLVRGARATVSVSTMLSVIERMCTSTTMDPVLQTTLLEGMLEEAASCAPHLAVQMGAAKDALRRLQLDAIEWIAPANPSQRPESREASEIISKTVEVSSWRKQHEKRVADVKRWLASTRIHPVGMLERTESGDALARIAAKATPKPPYDLFAVLGGSDGAPQLRTVGSVSGDGTASLTLRKGKESLPSGTLLFGGRMERMPEPAGP